MYTHTNVIYIRDAGKVLFVNNVPLKTLLVHLGTEMNTVVSGIVAPGPFHTLITKQSLLHHFVLEFLFLKHSCCILSLTSIAQPTLWCTNHREMSSFKIAEEGRISVFI